ncbi:unnamed protein product [Calypogeia fissa]
MEAFGVSNIAAAAPAAVPSWITCGIDSRTGNRRNGFKSSSSSSFAQFPQAQGERNASAVEGRGHLRTLSSKLALASIVSGLADAKSALAISYDEVVGAAKEAASSSTDSLNFDIPEVDTSGLTDFFSSNPLALLGGGAIIAVPLLITAIFKKSEGYGTVSAKQAFEKLGDKELNSQLLDIRDADGTKEGKPDLKLYKKKVTQLPYGGEAEEYVAKVLKKFKDVEDATIYVLDRFDGDSLTVAKLLVKGGFKAAYAIKDGAEGPGGWQNSELPWLVPTRFSLGRFKELISTSDTGNIIPATLGVAAAAGVGLVVFSEAETALQLLGSAALVQLFVKKFLFAADRKKTLEELKTFLDTKVAPKEIVEELKEIAEVILPKYEEVKEASVNGTATVESTVADVSAEMAASVGENTPAQEAGKETESATDIPRTSRPLSPYAQYPGMKPPSSPTPSRP